MMRPAWVALAIVFVAACHRAKGDPPGAPPEPKIKVTTVAVVDKPMPRFLSLTGTLAPNESSDVAANAAGAVLETKGIERGAFVEKGDVLARLDARAAALSTAEAEAGAQAAKAQLAIATTECERVEKLYKANAISGLEYDKQHGQCTAAMWAAKSADARLATARKGLGDATVRAPFAGMIADRFVSTGEYVRPDSKVARVVAIDPLRLELTVPEASVALVKVGLDVDFKVAAFPEGNFKGSVRYIGPTLRATSHDLLVEAVVPNPDKKLRPGMFATARIALGDTSAPVVPTSAIRVDGSLRRIFVVREGKIEERLAKLGEERDGVVALEMGAKAGEKVVSPLKPEVRDGAQVQ